MSSTAPDSVTGLTSDEAQRRLAANGTNVVQDVVQNPIHQALKKLWAPVPWMLEATIVLEILVHKLDEAVIISVLLLFNSILSFVQENQSNRALDLLRKRLSVQARVLRDGHWQLIPAEQLVSGDVIHLRLGDLAPADVRLFDGVVEADESELTGESLPIEKSAGATAYAGSRIKRGEASGEVTATGKHTYFGKTAELVKTAKTASHLQEIIFAIVKYLVILDVVLVGALIVYAGFARLPWSEVLPFALILLVASVPVALPGMFTVATALGALDMSHHAVLVTRLSAIEEAAAMDLLCTDKTGTITGRFRGSAREKGTERYSATYSIYPVRHVHQTFGSNLRAAGGQTARHQGSAGRAYFSGSQCRKYCGRSRTARRARSPSSRRRCRDRRPAGAYRSPWT